MTFSEWHSQLPPQMRKGDQLRAKQRFERIVKAGEFDDLQRALQAYYEDQRKNVWRQWEYSSTFLGSAKNPRWREWMPASIIPVVIDNSRSSEASTSYDRERAILIQKEMKRAFDRGQRQDVPEIGEILGRLQNNP